ncbi:hypothetical protein ACLOJK_030671 [Asimina triloba]
MAQISDVLTKKEEDENPVQSLCSGAGRACLGKLTSLPVLTGALPTGRRAHDDPVRLTLASGTLARQFHFWVGSGFPELERARCAENQEPRQPRSPATASPLQPPPLLFPTSGHPARHVSLFIRTQDRLRNDSKPVPRAHLLLPLAVASRTPYTPYSSLIHASFNCQ